MLAFLIAVIVGGISAAWTYHTTATLGFAVLIGVICWLVCWLLGAAILTDGDF
jgi:hypothetical protein